MFVPEWASAAKLALIEAQGAELRRAGADMDEAKAAAQAFAAAEGWFFVEDGAEPAQFDAYGAIGDELLDELGEEPGTVVVPVGRAARSRAPRALPQPVVLIVTGRNVDDELWRRAVESPDSFVV